MATPNVLGAYELLRRAMQEHALQEQGAGSGSAQYGAPEYNSNSYGSQQGGLLGRLLAQQAEQNPYQPLADNSRAAPSISADPNFRQLSRVPVANRTQGAIAAPNRYEDQLGTRDDRRILSDATPDPVRPGSQYAQGAMALCLGGPAGCVAGGGLTLAQILGGAALLGGGATILNSRKTSKSNGPKDPGDYSGTAPATPGAPVPRPPITEPGIPDVGGVQSPRSPSGRGGGDGEGGGPDDGGDRRNPDFEIFRRCMRATRRNYQAWVDFCDDLPEDRKSSDGWWLNSICQNKGSQPQGVKKGWCRAEFGLDSNK